MAQPTFTLTAGAGLAARIGTTRESLAGAKLTLKSNIRKGDGVVIDGGIEYIQDVVLTLDEDGKINGDTGVDLLADDASLGLENTLQWQVNIKNAKSQGFATSVSSWWINAGADGATVSLDDQPKAVGQTATGSRGLRGFPIDDVQRVGDSLEFGVQGDSVGTVDISDLVFTGDMDDITDAGDVGKEVTRSDTIDDARAVIGPKALQDFLYNFDSSKFLKWRKALVGVRNGVADAKILVVGDSTAAGVGSSTQATVPADRSWPTQLAAVMNTHLAPTTVGLGIPKSDSSAQPNDARWSATNWSPGPFSGLTMIGWGNKNTYWYTTTAGATLTYTPGVLADTYDVYYLDASGNKIITVQATGGSASNVSMVSPSLTVKKVTVTAAAASVNNTVTVTMTDTGGSNTRAFILGVEPSMSTTKQVRIGNAGVSGSETTGWVTYPSGNPSNDWAALASIKAYAPDLTIIDLGINDAGSGVSQATYAANLAQIIAAAQVSGDVVLKTMLPSNSGASPNRVPLETSYVQHIKSLGLPVIDVFNRIGASAFSAYNSAGFMSDNVHGNDYSYGDEAAMVLTALSAGVGAGGGPPVGLFTDTVKSAISTDAMTLANKTLTNPRMGAVKDNNGNDVLDLNAVADAFNYLQISNAASASPAIKAVGSGSNVNIVLQPKGTGVTRLTTSNGISALATGSPVTSAVNYIEVTQAATTNGPKVAAAGSDTNIDLELAGKGTGRPKVAALKLTGGSGTATVQAGSGSPEGVVSATPGSVYTNTNGGAGTTFYVKESGSGNTGWAAK